MINFLSGFLLSSLEKTLLLVNLVTVPGSMFIVVNFMDFLHIITWVSIYSKETIIILRISLISFISDNAVFWFLYVKIHLYIIIH